MSLKARALLGVVGLALVVGFYAFEESRVARARTATADAMTLLANERSAAATAAADAARAAADAALQAQRQLDAQLEAERALRHELAAIEVRTTAARTAADRTIARLRRENEELGTWAATRIPDDWVRWMLGELDDSRSATDGGRGAGDPLPGPAP